VAGEGSLDTAHTTRDNDAGALALVLAAVTSVQFGGALAATLVTRIGASGSVTLRLLFATTVLLLVARPGLRGHSRSDWLTVAGFGVALGCMNLAFYGSLAHLPVGVAVTVEFTGPLILAAVLSRTRRDLLAVASAALGVVLISEALQVPLADLEWTGLALAATAGAGWAAYIVMSGRTGARFPRLDGLALALVVSTVLIAPVGLRTAPEWTPAILVTGLSIAVLSSVLPYSLELLALRRLSARVFGILLSLEPAVAAFAGLVVLGQRLDPTQLVGMGLVVAASVLVLGLGRRPVDPADTGA
jgi:inner membrane transporter RhtA